MLSLWHKYGLVILAGLLLFVVLPIYLHTSSCEAQPQERAVETAEQTAREQAAAQQTQESAIGLYEPQAQSPANGANAEYQAVGWLCDYKPFDLGVVFFTFCLVAVGFFAMHSSDEIHKRTERAYVGMSHRAPGVEWGQAGGGTFRIAIEVKNAGRTPANVTATTIRFRAEPLLEVPDYSRPEQEGGGRAFLRTGDTFVLHTEFTTDVAIREEIENGTRPLFVYGYVDYIDVFGQRLRAGYAREYGMAIPNNNLVFLRRLGHVYIYDRLRKRREGIDWGSA